MRHVVEIGKNELPSCVREDTNSKLWTEARAQTNITRTSQIGRLTRKSMSVMSQLTDATECGSTGSNMNIRHGLKK
ncbi:hypothetical protein J6590_000357 [Homalodisca vitripennis]|nr:hypothetical protein J6590_000357 [Homalodisca vitripennis]